MISLCDIPTASDSTSIFTSIQVSPEKQTELIELVKQLSGKCEAVVVCGGLAKGMTPDYYGKLLAAVPAGAL